MTKGPIQLDVGVSYALPRLGLPAAVSFRKWVAAALDGRIREADLAVRLVGSKEGRALNRHYRGKDYATNVLSFPADIAEGVKLHRACRGRRARRRAHRHTVRSARDPEGQRAGQQGRVHGLK